MFFMNAVIRIFLAIIMLAGLQGMAVDITCMVLWHADPVELAEDGEDVHGHHPDSPESHQGASDVVHLFSEFGTMLLDHTDVVTVQNLIPALNDHEKAPTELLIYLLEPPLWMEGDPPKQTA